jgi:porin
MKIRLLAGAAGLVLAGALPAAAQSANSGLLGSAAGLRPALASAGITVNIQDSENLLGALSGGVRHGATMQGVTTGTLEVDTGKAFGLAGGTIHVSGLQIHGRSLSPFYLDDLQAANGNEGDDATRLWELWYDQSFAGGDLKIGQQSIDNEFISSQYSGLFVNTMAGWPLVPSDDLFGGGPAYPLSSLGARILAKPGTNATILAGVFDDNPGGGAFSEDAQALDAAGARFNSNTGALFIAELQYTAQPFGLAGTYKIGLWYDTGGFPDQEYGADGRSLADPDSDGQPNYHHGNDSLYGVVDQTIWQSKADSARGANVFARIMGAPGDQNLIDFSFNGGVTMTAPLSGRDNDSAGLDMGLGQVSHRARNLDRDAGLPVRGTEALIELTYQAQITPWLILQPDLQYVVNPGGGLIDPGDPPSRLHNELIAGLRAVVTF